MKRDSKQIRSLKLSSFYKDFLVLTFLLASALFYTTQVTLSYYDELDSLNQEYRYLQSQADTLREASDYLTDQVYCFMLSAGLDHLDAYFEEVFVTRRREKALNALSEQQSISYGDVADAASESNMLMQREIYAMKLMVVACGYDMSRMPEELRNMPLASIDLALSPTEQTKKARLMVHDDAYEQSKAEIYENLEYFSERALQNVGERITTGRASLQRAVNTAHVFLLMLVGLVIFNIFILAYLVLRPLNIFLADIKKKGTLSVVGSHEFKNLAQVYNRIYAEKEESDYQKQIYQHRAERDRLTGTYSREYFFEKAEEMIQASEDELYIVRINICRFKLVNELQGVEKGDKLLTMIGNTLNELGEKNGFIASRFTSDHFYVCIRKEDFERIEPVRKISVPWLTMDVAMTYGICQADHNTPAIVLCDRANMALRFGSRTAFKNVYLYNEEFHQQLLQEQSIESEMEKALLERQFCIYIQPKVHVETEKIVGGEALVRWIHPERGFISPGAFINVFEKNGFILPLDYFVWEECCRFLSDTKKKGLPHTPLSINVSRLHFYSGELQSKLLQLVDMYDLEPSDLELEVTESVYADEPDIILKQCGSLQKLGFKIAMDDFGSGYSSLNMLKKMPLDIIKMDLRFLANDTDATEAAKGRDILRTQIELAHMLDIDVVVEGLETKEQRDFIQNIGNCVAQGYYYSKPVDCQRYLELSAKLA